ncbi:MAG: hypothetical protein MMC23_005991 [Stictis urceolatum]|nr:hypothetical protein [Stictis urceolata]
MSPPIPGRIQLKGEGQGSRHNRRVTASHQLLAIQCRNEQNHNLNACVDHYKQQKVQRADPYAQSLLSTNESSASRNPVPKKRKPRRPRTVSLPEPTKSADPNKGKLPQGILTPKPSLNGTVLTSSFKPYTSPATQLPLPPAALPPEERLKLLVEDIRLPTQHLQASTHNSVLVRGVPRPAPSHNT